MLPVERQLLNIVQREFPLEKHPFATIGRRLGMTEQQCIDLLRKLTEEGILREIRPVISWNRVGFTGVLLGLEVKPDCVEVVASAINAIPGVTHNYLRDGGRLNLWCTLTYDDPAEKERLISFMQSLDGVIEVREFASEKTYKIGLVLDV